MESASVARSTKRSLSPKEESALKGNSFLIFARGRRRHEISLEGIDT